ncbi:MAG: hypothetical protein ABI675_03280 [Chitinophagaceae bacterium]
MNTSNKILTGFLIVIFLVPVFILLSFNSKIRNGQFTVVKNEQSKGANFRNGNFKPYKVVKLVSPPGRALKCNLQYADSLYYSYNINNSQDSIRVYNLGDTLFIQYIRRKEQKDNTDVYADNELYVEVKLPSVEQLVVNNAEAIISDMNASVTKNMLVEVYGTGMLNVGAMEGDDNDQTGKTPYAIERLSFKSANGEVSFGKNVHIGQLMIQADGTSTINIEEGAAIDDIQGSLSDSCAVKASWKYVKRLAVLNKN